MKLKPVRMEEKPVTKMPTPAITTFEFENEVE